MQSWIAVNFLKLKAYVFTHTHTLPLRASSYVSSSSVC